MRNNWIGWKEANAVPMLSAGLRECAVACLMVLLLLMTGFGN